MSMTVVEQRHLVSFPLALVSFTDGVIGSLVDL
jgi:hypothetical protein